MLQKYAQQIWILLAENFQMVVSELSCPFWIFRQSIFCFFILGSNPAVTGNILFVPRGGQKQGSFSSA